ncbi:hypothetical protein ABTW72_12170 [Micromonospora sp. NPDC127501]|uniref:hypothetical protein n=1 Tax=Micromonospora sp. NPDC127501 TaxID=3154872 RepID=UPI00331E1F5D
MHLEKGEPALRKIADATGHSVSTVHAALRARDANPSWQVVQAIVESLGGDVGEFRTLYDLSRAEQRGLSERAHRLSNNLDIDRLAIPRGQADAGLVCFWSFAKRDNDLESGRIVRLSRLVANEYELLTGEPLHIFSDHLEVSWGDNWRDAIGGALAKTAIFIPVITPLYLRTEVCRREFVSFAGRAASVDAMELLVPILYAETPAIADGGESDDGLPALIRELPYMDWRKNRLSDENSEQYRTAVHELATRLVEVVSSVTKKPAPQIWAEETVLPGFLDQLASVEEAVASWFPILSDLTIELRHAADAADKIPAELAKGGKRTARISRFALQALSAFAEEIREPSRKIEELGRKFGDSVRSADPVVQLLIRQARDEALPADLRGEVDEFFRTLSEMAHGVATTAKALREVMVDLEDAHAISRFVRAPLIQMREGLTDFVDAETVLNGWAQLARG